METTTTQQEAGASLGTEPAHALRLRGLTKAYGPVRAVDGIDLDVAPGEVVALLGPNGAGKSTTIDMVLGLTRPDAGSIAVFGRTPPEAVAEGAIGAMLQTGGVAYGLRVREVVAQMAALSPRGASVDDVLERAGLADIADRWAHRLSGGQTQRVRFAIALAGDPDLLVLDEPTVALDVEARHAFWDTMRGFTSAGRTVLFATHYLEEADAFADRVVLVSDGRVVADGTPSQVKGLVGGRTITATLDDRPSPDALRSLPAVTSVDARGAIAELTSTDSDTTLRALLAAHPRAHDIEIAGAGLETAFRHLTSQSRTSEENAR